MFSLQTIFLTFSFAIPILCDGSAPPASCYTDNNGPSNTPIPQFDPGEDISNSYNLAEGHQNGYASACGSVGDVFVSASIPGYQATYVSADDHNFGFPPLCRYVSGAPGLAVPLNPQGQRARTLAIQGVLIRSPVMSRPISKI